MGHHIEVLVCSSAQLVQPIDLSTPVYMLWLLESSLLALSVMNWVGAGMLHGVFIVVILIIHGAGCLRALLVDCVNWVILSF